VIPFYAAMYSHIGAAAHDLWRRLQQHRSLHPKGHFATASGLVLLSLAFTALVRLDVSLSVVKSKKVQAKGKTAVRACGAKPKRRYQEPARGRSRVSKDLRGGASRADYVHDVSRLDADAGEASSSGSGSSV
jgi:hypothetical protein